MWTVAQLGADLAAGRTSSRELVEQALARIGEKNGEGARAFVQVNAEGARAEADFADRLRKGGVRRSAVDGLPVALKDLFDVAGEVTRAGSKIMSSAPRKSDAAAIARLRAAGAVFIGRTNMVEFAFGGVGLNPHYGTPRNPWDRKTGRVPGGSSSGAAVAQADGMCVMALGSDTGGSVRIPSALCGLAGFKPTARRVPLEGAFPLSFTLDSIGPLANSIGCCAAYDAVLSGEPALEAAIAAKGLRLLVPRCSLLEDLDPAVEQAFGVALRELRGRAIREYEALAAPFDAIVMPTVACLAPTIAEADAGNEAYTRWNLRILRNPAFINFLDGCAASLPCQEPGAAPVGFMLCGPAMSDRRLLAVAAAVESALARD